MNLEMIVDAKAIVGEGPVWDDASQTLIWVDIMNGHIHRYVPATGEDTFMDVGQHVGAIIPRQTSGFVLATPSGFSILSEDGTVEHKASVEKSISANRMNDAKCDANGRIWAGTMPYDGASTSAALYRLNPDWSTTQVLSGITISNGTDWNLDNSIMYYIDSITRRVDEFDFDTQNGLISNRRPFIDFSDNEGVPDGMTVDSEGYLWVAFFGGSRVGRYSPSGDHDFDITLPTPQVTSVAFGGPDCSDLYITTAGNGLFDDAEAMKNGAGALFVCTPGQTGRKPNKFMG